MKRVASLLLSLAILCAPQAASAWSLSRIASGCVLGAATTGASAYVALGASPDGAKKNLDTQGITAAAVLGCLTGAFVAESAASRAINEMDGTLLLENEKLRRQVHNDYSVLCLMRGECNEDGSPIRPGSGSAESKPLLPGARVNPLNGD